MLRLLHSGTAINTDRSRLTPTSGGNTLQSCNMDPEVRLLFVLISPGFEPARQHLRRHCQLPAPPPGASVSSLFVHMNKELL